MCGLYGVLSYGNKVKDMAEITEALIKAGREDLIGFDQKCLIKPRKIAKDMAGGGHSGHSGKAASGRGGSARRDGERHGGNNGSTRR